MSIDRVDFILNNWYDGDWYIDEVVCDDGDYVKYIDYEKLEKENKALRELGRDMLDYIKSTPVDFSELDDGRCIEVGRTIRELTSRADKLLEEQ